MSHSRILNQIAALALQKVLKNKKKKMIYKKAAKIMYNKTFLKIKINKQIWSKAKRIHKEINFYNLQFYLDSL